jgi:translation initiation factor 3 subunit D
MASFALPYVAPNPDSWGPPAMDDSNPNAAPPGSVAKYAVLPYAPFGRSDRLGRAADFTTNSRGGYMTGGRQRREYRRQVEEEEHGEESFQLVDTSKAQTTKRFVNPANKRRQHSQRLRQINARRQQSAGGGAAGPTLDRVRGGPSSGGRGGGPGRGSGRGGGRGGRGGGRWSYNNRVDRQPSVAVQSDWKLKEEIDLGKLTKNLVASSDVPTPQDILWCGFLDHCNDAYDKITPRQPVPLKRMEHKEFYPVTTTDDPVLEKLAIDGTGQVFITDAILAHLMTCTRSVFPWDIVITKLPGGTIFFDKRDNSQFDYLTVYETAYSPPAEDEGPERLGLEATMVNQNFSQQILKKGNRKNMDLPNPFFDEDDADGMEPASVAFRYRKFPLDDQTMLVCRTELHGMVKKTQTMTAFALNEYFPANPSPQALSWRDKIESQRGAVLATELKNNSFKLAKWTAQSLLAGADQMKIGFVSRVAPKNAYEHVILASQYFRPRDLATQITQSENQMWAVFRMFVQLMQKQEDGKYVLMRDPNKAILNLYKVPLDTFDDEE